MGSDDVIEVPDGFVMLHCDGAVSNAGRICGCGGVFRNKEIQFFLAFNHGLENCSVLDCELWGIYHGICIGVARRVTKMVICTDALEAIQILQSTSVSASNSLVKDILEVIRDKCEIRWKYIPRYLNSIADCLAKNHVGANSNCNIYDSAPPFLADAIASETEDGLGPSVA